MDKISAKNIILKPIKRNIANNYIKLHHYSNKFVNNSKIHLGVFLNNKLEGVLQYGSPLDKRKILNLLHDVRWNSFLELNRMVLSERLPKNSESRAISISIKIIKKNYPFIKWIVSFSDATQCGDGTIYRASGFKLSSINKSNHLAKLPTGEVIHDMTLKSNPLKKRPELNNKSFFEITNGKFNFDKYCEYSNSEKLQGYQLRYIYFIDKLYEKKLKKPTIPFSKLKELGINMYKGKQRKEQDLEYPSELGGATPTPLLQHGV